MDFRYHSTSWTFGDFEVDVFAVSVECDVFGDGAVTSLHQQNVSTIRAEGLREHTPGTTGAGPSSASAVQNRRCSSPSPTVPTCIDPRLTVLWPSPDTSPGADQGSTDGDRTAIDDDAGWLEDLARARVPEIPGMTRSSTGKERKRTRSTVATQASAKKNTSGTGDKGQERTYARWKCGAEGGNNLSGSPTYISKVGPHAAPGPTSKGEGRKTEGIERIHTKLWKCRMGGCNKTFHRKGDAVRHLQTTAKHNGKSVVCSCGAPFSRHDALKRHQRLCNRHARELV